MHPTPIVLPGDEEERTVGANVETVASAVAAWPVVRRKCRRLKFAVFFMMGPDLSTVFSNGASGNRGALHVKPTSPI
jgi:hypothetical protein